VSSYLFSLGHSANGKDQSQHANGRAFKSKPTVEASNDDIVSLKGVTGAAVATAWEQGYVARQSENCRLTASAEEVMVALGFVP
jgi:hypothetical protein